VVNGPAIPDAGVKVSDLAEKPLAPETAETSASPLTTPAATPTGDDTARAAATPSASQELLVQVLIFPRPSPRVAFAANMLETRSFDATTLDVWAANGLSIGHVARPRLPLLLANLPPTIEVVTARLHPVNAYAPITLIERVQGQSRVHVIDSVGRPEIRRLLPGKAQVLVKLVPPLDSPTSPVQLDVLPHFYRPVSLLVPRTPDKRVLDGVSFNDLRIVRAITRDDVLVIWTDKANAPGTSDGADNANSDAAAGDVERPAKPTGEPVSIGELMLTGIRQSQPVQMMVIITLAEDAAKTP
jgi:hypothetical protein